MRHLYMGERGHGMIGNTVGRVRRRPWHSIFVSSRSSTGFPKTQHLCCLSGTRTPGGARLHICRPTSLSISTCTAMSCWPVLGTENTCFSTQVTFYVFLSFHECPPERAPLCLRVVLFSYLKSGMPAVCARGQIWNSFRGRWRSSSATRSVRQGNRMSTTVYRAW